MLMTDGFWTTLSLIALFFVMTVIGIEVMQKEKRINEECIRYPMTCGVSDDV